MYQPFFPLPAPYLIPPIVCFIAAVSFIFCILLLLRSSEIDALHFLPFNLEETEDLINTALSYPTNYSNVLPLFHGATPFLAHAFSDTFSMFTLRI